MGIFSENVSISFASVLVYMITTAIIRGVLNINLIGIVFWSFSQIFAIGFTSFLVYIPTGATIRDVLSIDLIGPILGHFVPRNRSKLRSLILFSYILHWFGNVLVQMLIFGTFRCI